MPDKSYYTIITGASEGLGKSFALECASRGKNLLLVALPGKELHDLAAFLRKNYPIEVIAFEKDLSDTQQCKMLFREVKEAHYKVNMLINNVGLGGTYSFNEGDIAFFEKQVLLNVMTTTMITKLFVNELEEHQPSHKLNVGSLASFFYLPRKQVYGATKLFVYSFSRSLRQELKDRGISVSVLCPGGINTNLQVTLMNKTGSWFSRNSIMSPEAVARIAIDKTLKGKEVIIPGKLNRFYLFLGRMLPDAIARSIARGQIKNLVAQNPFMAFLKKKPSKRQTAA
jgi:short-subunit dehydrogenase